MDPNLKMYRTDFREIFTISKSMIDVKLSLRSSLLACDTIACTDE